MAGRLARMAPLIDTHTHLDFSDFDADRAAVVARARAAGVEQMVVIGTRVGRVESALAWVAGEPGLHVTAGIHPGNVEEHEEADLERLGALCRKHRVAAVGECGLDYHRLPAPQAGEAAEVYAARLESWKQRQRHFFRRQLELAVEFGLGVVVHQRDSWADTLAVLGEFTGRVRAVFHCFGGTPEQVAELETLGHLVSFTGMVTFKNAEQVRASAAAVRAGGYMLETDCPYLAPVPDRGRRCEPAHVRRVAAAVAAARGMSEEAVAAETSATARAFFRLD